ncbi:MAG: cadherin domain-containing protein, partial [Acidobacteria bacterium]|nr:cadherin domain-containing protein [Acidobacteriota bacterium]
MTRDGPQGRLPAPSLPHLAILVLAAALLWLPADSARAQSDATRPSVTAGPLITSSPASGDTYRAGEQISVRLTFDEPVTVTGKPRLRIKIGDKSRWAEYDRSGADGGALIFAYTIKGNNADADGISIGKNQLKLNGGTIADAEGNAARLKHPALADQAGHKGKGAPDEPAPPPTPSPEATPTPIPEPEPAPATNHEPQFASDSAARSVDEHAAAGTSVGDPIVATDADSDALTYALSGADAGSFELDAASGQIRVKDALDYETKSGYAVTVSVHDGKDTAGEADPSIDDSISVRISVVNVDEPGVVSLVSQSDPPTTVELGSELSAVLLDPDGGVSGAAWTWQRSADRLDWQGIADAGAAAYTPSAADRTTTCGRRLAYADGHGAGKSAAAVSAGPAQAAVTRAPDALPQTTPVTPAKPQNFRAEPGHVEVTLKWDDPNDDSITKYQYRQRVGGTRGDWTDIPGSSATTTAYTIRGLTSETTYIFAVRARGTGTARFGKEAKASATTTAAPVPRCPKPDGVTTAPPTLAQAMTVTEGIKRDCNILLAVKATLVGADGPTLNWAYDADLADWEGVGVYEDQIEQLDLSHKGLKGTLPPALAQLSALQSLDLSGNMLTGSIPDLSALATLQKLTLGRNKLTGSIPSTLGALVNLVELRLNDNREVIYHRDPNGTLLTRGRHPDTGEQGKFRAEVVKEGLSGTIPDLSALSKLERLELSFNNLSGGIPTWLGELTALEYAWLGNNALSGPIPDSLGCEPPPALLELQLSHNQLSGEIPASLGRITTLRVLTMSSDSFENSATHRTNTFTGTMPTTIQRLRITSPTPDELRRLVGLEWGTGDASSCSKPVIRGEPRVYLTLSRTELAEGTSDFSRRYPNHPRGRDNPPDTNFADVGARLDQEADYDIVVDLALPGANLGYELTHHRLLIPAGQKTSSAAGPVAQIKTIDDQVYRSGVIDLEGAASGALKAFAPGSVKRISDESLVHGKGGKTLRPVCQTGSNQRDCDGGRSRPTLHGPERVVFSITENEPLPVVSLEVSGDPFEGDTVTLTARVWPKAAYDIVVTVNTPP